MEGPCTDQILVWVPVDLEDQAWALVVLAWVPAWDRVDQEWDLADLWALAWAPEDQWAQAVPWAPEWVQVVPWVPADRWAREWDRAVQWVQAWAPTAQDQTWVPVAWAAPEWVVPAWDQDPMADLEVPEIWV